ncbi:MAG TPA: hypothetical protein VGG28_29715 [Kofleriaceae bacterium]
MKLGALAVVCAIALPTNQSVGSPPGHAVRVDMHETTALPSRGPKHALVTVELFFRPYLDTRRPEFAAVEKLQADHPNRVRLVYRVLRQSNSSRLPYATLEAFAEGRMEQFFTELDKQSSNLTNEQLAQVATAAGMSPEQVASVILKPPPEFDAILDDNIRRSRQRLRNQTGVLINGAVVPQSSILKAGELERLYAEAKDAALDLIDRGVLPSELPEVLEGSNAPNPLAIVVQSSTPDDTVGELPATPQLASPPLDLRGMPSVGPANARTTIAVLCNPSMSASGCGNALRAAQTAQVIYGDAVRVVWAPFFDVARDDAGELGMLADAALCAERVGTSVADFANPTSPGWDWLQATINAISIAHRRITAEQIIAKLIGELHVDDAAFEACRAHQAGTAIRWAEAAARAGVHASPTTVVGGRIYTSITDTNILQQLVAAELEPGDCDGCLRLDTIVPAWRSDAPP